MRYTIEIYKPRPSTTETPPEPWPVISRVYVSTWQHVFKVLQWIQDRRLDFILTPDTEFGQGWKFEIQFPGGGFADYDAARKYVEELQNGKG